MILQGAGVEVLAGDFNRFGSITELRVDAEAVAWQLVCRSDSTVDLRAELSQTKRLVKIHSDYILAVRHQDSVARIMHVSRGEFGQEGPRYLLPSKAIPNSQSRREAL